MKYLLAAFSCLLLQAAMAQQILNAVVADSNSRLPLPFATILVYKNLSVISEMNGSFSIRVPAGAEQLKVSYVGRNPKIVPISSLSNGDTIFLSRESRSMEEVVIRSQSDRISRIINKTISRKNLNNPEQYEAYECYVYYKMTADILPLMDSTGMAALERMRSARAAYEEKKRKKGKLPDRDSAERGSDTMIFGPHRHLILSESYTQTIYKKPQQLQETVLASRFSGLKKTYFSNVVTDMIPFHVYTDYINLGGKEYSNPVAKGWQGRYRFFIEDEVLIGNDTVFILSYAPKAKTAFNGLTGLLYVNSNGYAISHFTGSTDTASDRVIQMEQIYEQKDGKWFPRELNYEMVFRRSPTPFMQFQWVGHSIVDSVSFADKKNYRFDKAHPVKIDDSVDLRTMEDWQRYRKDTMSAKESSTYTYMDSMFRKYKLEQIVSNSGMIAFGRWPIGKLDLEITRLVASNPFEGWRLGAGFYTNDKISKRFSIGGWGGYGTKDKTFKYGASAMIYMEGMKDEWIRFSYQKNYRNPGRVTIHPELEINGIQNWVLGIVDQFEAYELSMNLRKNYWEFRPQFTRETIRPLYENHFIFNNRKYPLFTAQEATLGFRFAYGEKRTPFLGFYFSSGTKYPVFYAKLTAGKLSAGGEYSTSYARASAALTWTKRLNRWGKDMITLEGGIIHSPEWKPLPRSYLFSGNGMDVRKISFYTHGGFMTMQPFDFYNDRYFAVFYKHDFDRYFWDKPYSKPFLSLAHNLTYGTLRFEHFIANDGLRSFSKGYHESGILLNQLIRKNFHFADAHIGGGYFYHWSPKYRVENGTWVVAAGLSF